MSLSKITTLSCGCPATWDPIAGEYTGDCQCPPEKQRSRWLASERARFASADASRRRDEAPLSRMPFSLLRRERP